MQDGAARGIDAFACQSGYFHLDGIALLYPSLRDCASRSGAISLVLGSNQGGTLASHVAYLAGGLDLSRANVSIGIVAFRTALFHPKVYYMERADGTRSAYVGSANLTRSGIGGLNIEAGIVLDTAEGDDSATLDRILAAICAWFEPGAAGVAVLSGPQDIDGLLAGRLLSERVSTEKDRDGEPEKSFAPAKDNLRPILQWQGLGAVETSNVEPQATLRGARRYTEASFHYPQGVHLGHVLSLLRYFSVGRAGTGLDDQYIRLNGALGTGRIAAYRRQVKYKILALTELGLLTDVRDADNPVSFVPEITALGSRLWKAAESHIDPADLELRPDNKGEYSTALARTPIYYNELVKQISLADRDFGHAFSQMVLALPAIEQMRAFLSSFEVGEIAKNDIYRGFFAFERVRDYCDLVGIEPQTEESARHRCPFLLNLLDSCGLLEQGVGAVRLLETGVTDV